MIANCSADYIDIKSPFIELASGKALSVTHGRVCGTITRQNFLKNFGALCSKFYYLDKFLNRLTVAYHILQIPASEKPFQVHYFTDGDESNDAGNTGFCFIVTQKRSIAQRFIN